MIFTFKQIFQDDLERILTYTFNNFGKDIESKLKERTENSIKNIIENPLLYPNIYNRPFYRRASLTPYPFNIYYSFNEERITFLRILHSSQNVTAQKLNR